MKQHLNKIIVIFIVISFGIGLFFSVRYLRAQINSAISALDSANKVSINQINFDAWNKIKHRFGQ